MIEALAALSNTPALARSSDAQSIGQGPAMSASMSASMAPGAQAAQGPSFTEAMSRLATNAVNTVAEGEAMAKAGALGEASLHDVVHSVVAAELTVQAVVSVRDRAVQAYQELLRMPV